MVSLRVNIYAVTVLYLLEIIFCADTCLKKYYDKIILCTGM